MQLRDYQNSMKKKTRSHWLVKHGMHDTKTYKTWEGMIQRCNNPKNPRYKNYGGRGISVCQEWNEFLKFVEDMGVRPDGYQIDRIDNDGDYSKENCRWIPKAENQLNKRTSKWWYVYGEKFSSAKIAAKKFGVCQTTICSWCDGYITKSGNYSPPKKGCWSELKYKGGEQ